MVIHIFKDGTTTTELKDVYVPQEIVQSIYKTVKADKEKSEREGNETNNLLG
jgi:hypothetical protein